MAEGETKSKSLSWIHTGKPSETDSSCHNLGGPKRPANLAEHVSDVAISTERAIVRILTITKNLTST